jgi:hypothetical protein
MRFIRILVPVIFGVLILLGLAAVLFVAGRQLVILLDGFATSPPEPLPTGRYLYGATHITICDTDMELMDVNEIPVDIRYDINPAGRLTLHTQGKAFPLGTLIGPKPTNGPLEFPFTADDGDVVSFTRYHSLLGWPTPFEVNWLGGRSPTWRRNLYHRLSWHKRSGEALSLLWRFEEGLFRDEGWRPSSRLGAWGLVDVSLVGPADGQVEDIEHYLRRTKGWFEGDYRCESAGVSPDGCCDVVRILHRFDEQGAHPGGGLSVELWLDRKTHAIKRELGMQ